MRHIWTRTLLIGIGLLSLVMADASFSYAARFSDEEIARFGIRKEENSEYRMGKEDVIEIAVRLHPEYSGVFPINAEGKVQYPFVGDIRVEGMTKAKAVDVLREALKVFLEEPEVYITIKEYNSKVVYVVGMVKNPGKHPMKAEVMPLRDAVLAAGLPREHISSLRRSLIIRPLEDGRIMVKKVNLLALLYEGKVDLNYDLRHGDTVYVPATAVYKFSEVFKQVIAPLYQSAYVIDEWQDLQNNNN